MQGAEDLKCIKMTPGQICPGILFFGAGNHFIFRLILACGHSLAFSSRIIILNKNKKI